MAKEKLEKNESPVKVDDVVLVHGRTEDGQGVKVLRKKGDELSAGEVRPVKEGMPLSGELVALKARKEQPGLYDVDSHYTPPQAESAANDRPAKVASTEFRSGWDQIWGGRRNKMLN